MKIDQSAFIHPLAFVCGDVRIGQGVFVAPFASIRADEGAPFHIGDNSNVQDGVVLHGLETTDKYGNPLHHHLIEAGGDRYSIYIGCNVSLAHQSQVHGPALIGDGTFVGMQALVMKSRVGRGCVIEPGAKIIGVTVEDGRYVPAGAVIDAQASADKLPLVTADYPLARINEEVVKVNRNLTLKYKCPNLDFTSVPC